ncbi:MAG TPA: hypothetical protein VHS96_11810 [Bacteroidia bacterium]|nr:hypothetical protein [Bacteroidia bacterium]
MLLLLPCGLSAQPKADLEPRVTVAIDRAVAYFQAHRTAMDPDAYLFYHFLSRKFGLPAPIPADSFVAALATSPFRAEIEPFLRIIGVAKFKRAYLKASGSLNDITLAGIWHDRLRNKKILEKRILQMDFGDDYNITHAFLALALARRCFGADIDAGLWKRIGLRMEAISQPGEAPYCDVNIEALAMRCHDGQAADIPDAAILKVISQQTENGSWQHCPDTNPMESQHTTVLALWALLEWQGKGNPQVTLIGIR